MAAPASGATVPSGSIDPREVALFDAMAAGWWDPKGQARPLHAMNPVRLDFIRARVLALRGGGGEGGGGGGGAVGTAVPLAGLRALDVGCGGGLLAEPLARMGARVTGIDAAPEAIAVARDHAAAGGLEIDYRVAAAEDLAASGTRFDLVCALEIVEHVADVDAFCAALSQLVAPGGLLVMSTLNRTAKSWAVAILGAEHLARVIPRGTHDWRKFLRPAELAAVLRRHGLRVDRLCGMVPALGAGSGDTGGWRLSDRRLAVNYILSAVPG